MHITHGRALWTAIVAMVGVGSLACGDPAEWQQKAEDMQHDADQIGVLKNCAAAGSSADAPACQFDVCCYELDKTGIIRAGATPAWQCAKSSTGGAAKAGDATNPSSWNSCYGLPRAIGESGAEGQ